MTVTFPAGRERNIALGVWGALAAIGGTLGVVAGGVLVDAAGWQWIFFVNVPFALLALVAAPRVVTESRRTARRTASTSPARCSPPPACSRSSTA